jgi:formiminotetrahydrofolate cyclodeaminase
VHAQTVGEWLEALASGAPAPGGGAAAAMEAAVGAALISMVCSLTIGKQGYAAHEQTMTDARERAAWLRERAIDLANADARAFEAVVAAYRLPRQSDAERAARTDAIQAALVEAGAVPLATAEVAAEVIALAERILAGANATVVSDVAVAASSARAALDAAAVNVEVNLAAMRDGERRRALATGLAAHASVAARADEVVRAVRARIAG